MVAKGHTDGYLFDLYRRYIGEPDGRTDVYLGFGLFLGGIGLAIAGLGLFLYSSTLEARSTEYLAWVEPAYALGMLSLPATMLGIVTLLPTERRVVYTSLTGALVTVVAVVGFVSIYPDWNFYESSDAAYGTVHVVATYAVGLASITAATGAALIAHYLDLARTVERLGDDDADADRESYTDEEIRGDIDEAMDGVELSWGGVEKDQGTQLQFTDHEFEGAELNAGTETVRSSGVDEQVAGLKGLKGGETKTTTSSGSVDDQTAKLKELRERQQRGEVETPADGGRFGAIRSAVGRVTARLFGGR